MKILSWFLATILFINIGANSQAPKAKLLHDPGIYLGGYWSKTNNLNLIPQVWFYAGDFYIESRYNYEDENTFSVHLGKPVEIDELRMEVTPTVGLVFGNFKGYSIGLNAENSTPHLSAFAENEYCFSPTNTNFFFSWAGFTTPVVKNLAAGASWQYTLEPFSSVIDIGPMISYKKKRFGLELYSYNPWKANKYWQFGLSFDFASTE